MRDPKRIERVLDLIKDIWSKNPDLRLCQLIGNCFSPGDHYYIEDGLLEASLMETYYNQEREDMLDSFLNHSNE